MRSLLGAARAAAASGDRGAAGEHYATLARYWAGATDDAVYREASQFAETNEN